MFILAATFNRVRGVQFFVASKRTALAPIMRDASDWRLAENDTWIDSKNEASWQTFPNIPNGEMACVITTTIPSRGI